MDLDYVRLHLSLQTFNLQPGSDNRRLVLSMTTFSNRVRATSLLAIKSLVTSEATFRYERFIITIPLVFRSGIWDSPNEPNSSVHLQRNNEIIQDVLSFYAQEFGVFKPVTGSTVKAFQNDAHSIYLQFLENQDFGPATKLLGALLVEKEPTTIILTVDDDIEYSPSLLPFIRSNTPADAAFSSVCQTTTSSYEFIAVHDGSWGAKWLWRREPKLCPGWLVGWAGVAYRVSFFSDDVFLMARNLSHACFLNDDVWLSGYLKFKGIVRVVYATLPGGHHHRHPSLSLSVIPDAQGSLMLQCAVEMGFRTGRSMHHSSP